LAISLSSPLYPGKYFVHEKKGRNGFTAKKGLCEKNEKKAIRISGNINGEVDQEANIRRLMQFRNGE